MLLARGEAAKEEGDRHFDQADAHHDDQRMKVKPVVALGKTLQAHGVHMSPEESDGCLST